MNQCPKCYRDMTPIEECGFCGHRAALPPVRVEADVRLVASFRLPVAVKGLIFLSDWLRKQYGEGLTMRQQGEFLFIEKPNARNQGLAPQEKTDA